MTTLEENVVLDTNAKITNFFQTNMVQKKKAKLYKLKNDTSKRNTKMMNNDLKYGLQNETDIKPFLEKHYGRLHLHPNKYAHYDFFNQDVEIELKSRIDTASTSWPTTYLCKNKIKYALTSNKRYDMLFHLSDGVFLINFQDNIEWFENNFPVLTKLKRGDKVWNYHIPISMLTRLE